MGWPRSRTSSAGDASSRATATSDRLARSDGRERRAHDVAHRRSSIAASANTASIRSRSVTPPTTSASTTGGSCLTTGHLADAVLAQDGDGLPNRLVGVGVHQRREVPGHAVARRSPRSSRRRGGTRSRPSTCRCRASRDSPRPESGMCTTITASGGQVAPTIRRGGDGGPARSAEQQPLLPGHPPGGGEALGVGDGTTRSTTDGS